MTRARNKPKAGRLKKWLLWFNIIFILLLGLTYITPLIRVETWGWLSLLALAYPFIMLINGLFAIGWFFFRSGYAVLSILMIIAGYTIHTRYVKLFSMGGGQIECRESIRLISYNMRGLSLVPVKDGAGIRGKIDSLYHALNSLEEFPDIFCLQEASGGELIARRFGLEHSIHAPKSTLWLLSRFPILKHGEIKGQEVSPSCIWADIKTDQGIVRIYNMHLVSNRVTKTAEDLIQELDLNKESTWNSVRFIVSRYRHTTKKRAIEARAIRDHMNQSPYPAILTGDGNDTPLSHTFHLLATGLQDSFQERGSGLSTTYASTLPLLRIDYLLGSEDIYFKDHFTHHISYSDHYPVSAGICLLKPSGS